MLIEDRIDLYKSLFPECKALTPVAEAYSKLKNAASVIDSIEIIRELATRLTQLYKVTIPTVTFFVRDHSYVAYTDEIFLGSIDPEAFLREYRFHLQNEARKYDKRYLLLEEREDLDIMLPFTDTESPMYGSDDAEAWALMLIESLSAV